MVVRSPSVAKREMRLMPETPPLSFAQLSVFPTPSEVTTPIPVTAMMGRPFLSRVAVAMEFPFSLSVDPINLSVDPFDQRKPLAAPIAHAGDDDLGKLGRTSSLVPRSRRCE